MTRFRLALILLLTPSVAGAQQLTGFERQRGLIMLDVIRSDIEKNYFDSAYGGTNLVAVFDTARTRIQNSDHLAQLLGAIGQATLELNDSHTIFLPPGLVYRAEYGWDMRFVGDTCRVFKVKAGSDAEAKGMKVGDAVLAIEGFRLTRQDLWRLRYMLNALQPRTTLRVALESPQSSPRQVDITAAVIERRHIVDPESSFDVWELIREGDDEWEKNAPRYIEIGDHVMVWQPHEFYSYTSWIDDLAKRARSRDAVILDLRGNHGGAVKSLLLLIGRFYDKDLLVATTVERKRHEDMTARGTGKDHFEGTLVVLVDAESASASEIFARTVQLTGRGKVIGDRTAGAVRESITYVHAVGTQTAAFYGASITIADLLMPDGGRLENAGVMPDEVILPTGDDLSAGRDPAMARALAIAGAPMTAEEAGALRKMK